ncbi:MAG: RNA polymerase sigma factor [Gemmatimonadales bacterium]
MAPRLRWILAVPVSPVRASRARPLRQLPSGGQTPRPGSEVPPHRAFEEVIAEHLDALFRTALGLCGGHEADAEDLLQEAALRAFNAYGGLREPSAARSWLFTILGRTHLNRARRARRRAERSARTWMSWNSRRPSPSGGRFPLRRRLWSRGSSPSSSPGHSTISPPSCARWCCWWTWKASPSARAVITNEGEADGWVDFVR